MRKFSDIFFYGVPGSCPNKALIFETEIEFLHRHQLLTRAEQREFPALLRAARESQKERLLTRGYTRAELARIFAEWDGCAAEEG